MAFVLFRVCCGKLAPRFCIFDHPCASLVLSSDDMNKITQAQLWHHCSKLWLATCSASSHYLNQCCRFFECTAKNKLRDIFIEQMIICRNIWKCHLETSSILSRLRCVKHEILSLRLLHKPLLTYHGYAMISMNFNEFYISLLVFSQRLQLFVQSPQPYLLIFDWGNWLCFPNILGKHRHYQLLSTPYHCC